MESTKRARSETDTDTDPKTDQTDTQLLQSKRIKTNSDLDNSDESEHNSEPEEEGNKSLDITANSAASNAAYEAPTASVASADPKVPEDTEAAYLQTVSENLKSRLIQAYKDRCSSSQRKKLDQNILKYNSLPLDEKRNFINSLDDCERVLLVEWIKIYAIPNNINLLAELKKKKARTKIKRPRTY